MNTPSLRLSLIQDNPVTGAISRNTGLALQHLEAEAKKGADLVVFSECFITGYPVGDLVLRPGFLRQVDSAITRIRDAVVELNGPAVLIGAPKAGAILPYNSAFLIEPSGAIRVVNKAELPNSDVFDERRTFQMSGDPNPGPLLFRGFSLGVEICEDMWHGRVSTSLAEELADVLLVLNGSPYAGGKIDVRLNVARARIRSTGLPLIYVNQVGGQDELVFDGASFVMNIEGRPMMAAAFEPDVMRIVLRRNDLGETHIEMGSDAMEREPAIYPKDGLEADWRACVVGLRDYVRKSGFERVILGVSGGLDSAIVLAMAADALGPENVCGVMLPSRHTGDESLGLAADLMGRLGVLSHVLSIQDAVAVVDETMEAATDTLATAWGVKAMHGVARENHQARIRGLKLMSLSNSLGAMVLSTGNKSEMAVGYATLYGDMAGGFNPLKNVYKTRAFAMAKWRNQIDPSDMGLLGAANPIPEGIIVRPPTAELAEGQTDQASLGEYFLLDAVLHAMIEERMGPEAAAREVIRNFGEDEVIRAAGGRDPVAYARRIAVMVRNAQFKRDQACPGVKIGSGSDFGLGWRYPIAGQYEL